jgi:hypothetical protein
MTDLDQFDATLRRALDQADFSANRSLGPGTRVVQGDRRHIWDVIDKLLLGGARSEYLGLDDPSYLMRAKVEESIWARGAHIMKSLADRGVRIRQLSTRAGVQADEETFPCLQWRIGGEARLVDRLPTKACIIDRRLALVPIDLAVLARGMLVVTDRAVVDLLVSMHQSLWRTGVELRRSHDEPPPALRPILAMLASGMPDDRAAKSAGLSPRTYSRRVAELMQALGAKSRFEAGIEASRRGWV